MVKVKPFRAYLANQSCVDRVVALPYDVLTVEEAREDAEGNPMCYYHVNIPAIDLPDDCQKEEIYQMGRKNLLHFIDEGYLVEDDAERMYVYGQKMGDHQQYGIVALSSVHDYETEAIKKHELTLPKKELDRTDLCDIQGANAGPVFLAFKEGDLIQMKIQEVIETEPYAHVVTEDTFEHTLWKIPVEDAELISSEFENIEATYIADGHHRAAAAFNVGKRKQERALEAGVEVTGEEPFNYFMSILYPAETLKILEYNRVLTSLNDLTTDEFMTKLSEYYDIEPVEDGSEKAPKSKGQCSLLIDNKWFYCTIKPELMEGTDSVSSLDCALLTEYCFK